VGAIEPVHAKQRLCRGRPRNIRGGAGLEEHRGFGVGVRSGFVGRVPGAVWPV